MKYAYGSDKSEQRLPNADDVPPPTEAERTMARGDYYRQLYQISEFLHREFPEAAQPGDTTADTTIRLLLLGKQLAVESVKLTDMIVGPLYATLKKNGLTK